MKIAVIGVPGSGKTEFAQALFWELKPEPESEPFMIIDDYVKVLEEDTDLALGWDATYIGNLHVALRRETLERRFVNTITCGSLLETAAYTAQAFEQEQHLADEAELQDLSLRIEATFRLLASFYMDTFRYNYVFYLPNNSTQERSVVLDRNLQAATNAFNLVKVHPMLEPDVTTRVAQALLIMNGEHESSAEGQNADATSSV